MAIMAGVSTAISFLYKMAVANEQFLSSAKELTTEFKNSESSISEYKSKIHELQATIKDESSSIADVTNARKDLMNVQDELINKFGTEKETVDIITDAINNQSDALDKLSEKQYQQWKNEFNDKTFTQNSSDFLSSRNIENALAKLTDFDLSGAFDMLTSPTESNIDKMVASIQYAYYQLEKTGDTTLDSLIQKTYNLQDNFDGSKFIISGNLNNVHEDLLEIQQLSTDFNISDAFESNITQITNAANKTLDAYKNAYDSSIMYEKILNNSPNNTYDEMFNSISKAKQKYDEALLSGDNTKTVKASADYAKTLSEAMSHAIQNNDGDVADFFANMYPELQQQVGEWKFDANFEPNTNGLKDKVQNSLTTLAGYSTEDILNFNPYIETKEQQDAYADLNKIAHDYGLTLDQLIAKLEKEKLVASETTQTLQKKYGSKINDLSDEDYAIAAKVSDGSVKSWEELIAKIDEYKAKQEYLNAPPTLTLSSTINQLSTQMKPAFESIKSAYQNIFTDDGFTLEHVDLNMLDGLKSTFDDLNEIEGVSIDYSSFEDLSKVLLDSSSSADDVGNAFNAMAADVINSLNPSLSRCSAENYKLVQSMLESLGIQNSEQVMLGALGYSYEDYLAAKAECANAGFNLADATEEEINKFIEEQGGVENCGNALALFQLKKLLVANTGINQSSDIQQILGLASAAGLSTSALSRLAEAKSMLDTAIINGDTRGIHEAKKYAAELEKEIKNDLNAFELPTVDYKSPAKGGPSNKGNADNKDTHKEAYEKELSSLEYLHKMTLISDKDYYNQLNTLNETYFNDTTQHHEKYLDEYQANEEKVAQGLKDVWTKYWEDYKSDLDKVSSYAERVLSKQIDSLKDKQEQEVDGKEQEINAIDGKISALNKEKDATEKLYQDQIDAIQDQIDSYNDQIDKLKEINEEKNRQLKLEQDLYELERLRNQKTQKEYVEGKGTVYKADSSAIRDQEQQVENDRLDIEIAGYENLIKGLEAQQDSLKEKMDSVITSIDEQIARLDEQKEGIQEKIDSINQGYEAQIEALERYKEKWTEVSDYQAILDEEALTRQLLGVDAEQNILDMRGDILNDYISKYQLATDNLTLLSDAKLFEINEILARMQAAADLVDTTSVKENLSTTGTIADTTRDQISNVTAKFNDLAGEVSAFTLPPINTEQFIASLGTAEGSTGILGQLQTFTDRFREICSLIPTSWQNALDSILGSGPTDGKGIDYNILFIPLLSAMDNCKLQMDTKLAEYATAWIDFNTNLGAIIGIGGATSKKDKPTNSNNTTNENEQELNPSSANSILSTIKTGGKLINEEFDTTWIPGFQSMGTSINDICSNIVSCVNQMAEKTVDACRKAIDAINKANAAKDSSSSNNAKPPEFHLDPYKDISFDFTKPALKSKVNSSLAGEHGAKLVFDKKTNQYRYVRRDDSEFADLSNNLPDGYTKINRTEHLMELKSKSNPAAIPQDIDLTRFLDLPVTNQNMNYPIPLNNPLDHLNSLTMKDIIPTPVTQEINLTLPNVTNESGAQYIIKTLKQLPSDTIQYTHRR